MLIVLIRSLSVFSIVGFTARLAALSVDLPGVPESWEKLNGTGIVAIIVLGGIYLLRKPCEAWADRIKNAKQLDPVDAIREMSGELRHQSEILSSCFSQQATILAQLHTKADMSAEKQTALSVNLHEYNRTLFKMLAQAILKDPSSAMMILDVAGQGEKR